MYNDDDDDVDEQRTIELLSVRSTNCVYGKATYKRRRGHWQATPKGTKCSGGGPVKSFGRIHDPYHATYTALHLLKVKAP